MEISFSFECLFGSNKNPKNSIHQAEEKSPKTNVSTCSFHWDVLGPGLSDIYTGALMTLKVIEKSQVLKVGHARKDQAFHSNLDVGMFSCCFRP